MLKEDRQDDASEELDPHDDDLAQDDHHPKDDDHVLDGDEVLARGVTLACRHPVAKHRLDLQGTKNTTHSWRADLMTTALDPRDLAVARANPLSELVLSDAQLGAEVDHPP